MEKNYRILLKNHIGSIGFEIFLFLFNCLFYHCKEGYIIIIEENMTKYIINFIKLSLNIFILSNYI
jgi:hypothetical protein